MGFRFFRKIKVLPGVYLNIGKTGTSVSVGPRGLKTTISPKGVRHSIGLPGTGLSYQTRYKKWGNDPRVSANSTRHSLTPDEKKQRSRQNDYQKLDLGFLAKLTCSKEEKALIAGLQACLLEDYALAEQELKKALCFPDAFLTLGIVFLNTGRYAEAEQMFTKAENYPARIGEVFKKYNLEMQFTLNISPYYTDTFAPGIVTSILAHVEALQQLNKTGEACSLLLNAYKCFPQELAIVISLAELILEKEPNNQQWMNAIINLTKKINNDTCAHTVLLMYKAEAFDNINMPEAAITTLSFALRRKSGRPEELLMEMLYQRGVLFMKTGQKCQASKDLREVFAKDPGYANVNQLLRQLP